ncbi:DUF4209 domain-containing protein [Streptomyces tanashiensis]|uniref:DUF4209 domain-containing protein n=1 Tax=Streptomyces tanashiensis TaxID=67367 RepID=UPI00368C24CE
MIDEATIDPDQAPHKIRLQFPVAVIEGPLDEQDPGALARKAASWAFSYQVNVDQTDNKWKVYVVPFFEGPSGSTMPPQVKDVPEAAVQIWRELALKTTAPYALSRLHHILFERRAGNVRHHAIVAAENYITTAQHCATASNKERYLNPALRVARAVGASEVSEIAIGRIIQCIRDVLSGTEHAPGIAMRLIRPLIGDPQAPPELHEILEEAFTTYDSPFIQDEFVSMQIKAAKGKERSNLARKRVDVWLKAAQSATGLVRSTHLKKALECAHTSGIPDLIKSAAAELQKTRDEDLGLASFTSSMQVDREQLRLALAPVIDASDWREALVRIVTAYGPAAGQAERNRRSSQEFAQNSIVLSLATTELFGADGLPRFTPQNDEDRAEMGLARQETFNLQAMAPLISLALAKVAEVHGIPSEKELQDFLTSEPLTNPSLAGSISRSLIRYWSGDAEGAAFTIAPRVEALTRELVLAMNAGVYRLQRNEKPGQYPGLAVLLNTLREKGMDESWYRNILTICGNPAGGWNLRNDMAHGFMDNVGSHGAAVLLQAALYLWLLGTLQEFSKVTPGDEV